MAGLYIRSIHLLILLKKVVKKGNVSTVAEEVEKGAILIQNSYKDETAHFWMPYSHATDWEASQDWRTGEALSQL